MEKKKPMTFLEALYTLAMLGAITKTIDEIVEAINESPEEKKENE